MPLSFTPGISEVVLTASQMGGTSSATQGGTGLTSIGVNQTYVGDGTGAVQAMSGGTRLVAYASALALTASGDIALTMSNSAAMGACMIRRVTWGFPNSSALATVIVVATLRTASNGGGSALTGALVVTGLAATTAFLDQAVTLASGVTTSSQYYVNVTTAAGTAPPSQLFVYADCIGV